MEYLIKIDEFEGPLDLLLHLIKKSEVNIYDISIQEVTKQYIEYIHLMEQLQLVVASEYLVMAADLIKIKSSMLLPKQESVEESMYEENPEEQLIKRLIEYKRYKEVSNNLNERMLEREDYYAKIYNDDFEVNTTFIVDENVDSFDLIKALVEMKNRKEIVRPLTTVVEKSELTIEERMETLTGYLAIKKASMFSELFDKYDKSYIIITFLAVLELVKERQVVIEEISSSDFKLKIVGGLNA